jgi:hypothetical protein
MMNDDTSGRPQGEIVVLDRRAINDLVGKVAQVAGQQHTETELKEWRARHGGEHVDDTRAYAVVGETLMYLHTCRDGVVVPVALYPDGSTKIYSDHEHVGEFATAV